METKIPLYVCYKVNDATTKMLDGLLPFKKDFDDEYHCTVLYSNKEVTVANRLLGVDILVPMFTAKVIGYEIFESEKYGKSFVLKLDSKECNDTHDRLMKKYDASFDYDEYVAHTTLMYDLPDTVNPDELFKIFDGIDIVFDKIRYEKI